MSRPAAELEGDGWPRGRDAGRRGTTAQAQRKPRQGLRHGAPFPRIVGKESWEPRFPLDGAGDSPHQYRGLVRLAYFPARRAAAATRNEAAF